LRPSFRFCSAFICVCLWTKLANLLTTYAAPAPVGVAGRSATPVLSNGRANTGPRIGEITALRAFLLLFLLTPFSFLFLLLLQLQLFLLAQFSLLFLLLLQLQLFLLAQSSFLLLLLVKLQPFLLPQFLVLPLFLLQLQLFGSLRFSFLLLLLLQLQPFLLTQFLVLFLFLLQFQPFLLLRFSFLFLLLLQLQPFLFVQFSFLFLLLLQLQPFLLLHFSFLFLFLLRFIWLSRCHQVFLSNSGRVYVSKRVSARARGLPILLRVACGFAGMSTQDRLPSFIHYNFGNRLTTFAGVAGRSMTAP